MLKPSDPGVLSMSLPALLRPTPATADGGRADVPGIQPAVGAGLLPQRHRRQLPGAQPAQSSGFEDGWRKSGPACRRWTIPRPMR
ncbi:hypothetical protein ACPA9J_35860 [Pseudomonas aeruginosa]